MAQLLRAYFDILILRRGPEILPASLTLLVVTMAANAALAVATILSAGDRLLEVFAHYLLSVVMLLSVLWLVLNTVQRTERYVQSVTALFGADLLLSAAQAVVYLLAGDLSRYADAQRVPFAVYLLYLLFGWFLVLVTFVIRRATGLELLPSIGITVLYFVLYLGAVEFLFGSAA